MLIGHNIKHIGLRKIETEKKHTDGVNENRQQKLS